MDKKTLLAIGLSFVIWLTWNKVYLEPIQQRAQQAALAQDAAKAEATHRDEAKAALSADGTIPSAEKKEIESHAQLFQKLDNPSSSVLATNGPSALEGWELENFSRTIDKKDDKIGLEGATGFSKQISVRFTDPALTSELERNWDSLTKNGDTGVISKIDAAGVAVERKLTLDSTGYGATLDYRFQFKKEVPPYVFLDMFGSTKRENDKEGSIFGQSPDKVSVVYRDSLTRFSEIGAHHKEDKESAAVVKWIGLDTRYFVLSLVPEGANKENAGAQVTKVSTHTPPAIRGSLAFPTAGKKDFTVSTKVYFGPKEIDALRAVDPALTDTIDFGWTSFLAFPLLQALKWLYSFIHNYGLAIIMLTFAIKLCLVPLTYKSMKSMANMAKMQPQLNALREKYKDNKEKLNTEMMAFMRTNGYNPVGGCLPIVIQMPIFFALYRVLFKSMELYQAPFMLWIHDLSSPDPWFIMPVMLMGLMFLQQRLSPSTTTDPAQQKMMQIMPVMFGMFMFMLPAGLNVYMIVNTSFSIAQQFILNRKLGIVRGRPGALAKA